MLYASRATSPCHHRTHRRISCVRLHATVLHISCNWWIPLAHYQLRPFGTRWIRNRKTRTARHTQFCHRFRKYGRTRLIVSRMPRRTATSSVVGLVCARLQLDRALWHLIANVFPTNATPGAWFRTTLCGLSEEYRAVMAPLKLSYGKREISFLTVDDRRKMKKNAM